MLYSPIWLVSYRLGFLMAVQSLGPLWQTSQPKHRMLYPGVISIQLSELDLLTLLLFQDAQCLWDWNIPWWCPPHTYSKQRLLSLTSFWLSPHHIEGCVVMPNSLSTSRGVSFSIPLHKWKSGVAVAKSSTPSFLFLSLFLNEDLPEPKENYCTSHYQAMLSRDLSLVVIDGTFSPNLQSCLW